MSEADAQMGRTGFVVQRLLLLIPVAVGVTIIVFFMVHLIPGDPAATILGIHATPKAVALLHQQWGLNRPLASQYWLFLDRLLHGNLGQSMYYGGSVSSLILSHLPPTLWLLAYATVLTVLISVPLAVLAASRRDGIRDHVVRAVPLVGLGMPQFWLGFLLIYAFAISLRIFPVSGYGTGFTGHLQSMFLPSLTVAFALTPVVIRSLRASMLNVLTRRVHRHGQIQGGLRRTGCSCGTCCGTPSSPPSPCWPSTSASWSGRPSSSSRYSRSPGSAS